MIIDTHAHLDTEDFKADLPEVIRRAHEAGVGKIFLPAVDLKSVDSVLAVCRQFPDTCWPMIGLQPEEVRDDWREVLAAMHRRILLSLRQKAEGTALPGETVVAIGEVGLDFYWSREYERQQLAAFEEAVKWSVETRLPLMIHCRKAQNELLRVMRAYERELPGGVFTVLQATGKKLRRSSVSTVSSLASGACQRSRAVIFVRIFLRQSPWTVSFSRPTALIWLLSHTVDSATRVPSS